jgi:hypothetical protein
VLRRAEIFLRRTDPGARWAVALIASLVGFASVAARVHAAPLVTSVVCSVLLLGIAALAYRRAGFDGPTVAILVSAIGLYLAYLGYTDAAERNYDGPEQLDYIQYIAEHGVRPPATRCLICHHPPLYYYLAAGAFLLFRVTHVGPPVLGAQLLSLLFFAVFLGFAVKLFRRFSDERRLVRLAVALVAFWPYSFMMSVRVHNDALAGTLMMAALYFTVRFDQEGAARDLYLAAASVALGLLTKTSSVTFGTLLAVVAALKLWRGPDRLRLARRVAAAGALCAGALVLSTVGRGPPAGPRRADLCHRVLGNACNIGRQDWVGNEPYNYIYVDVPNFLKEPYLIAFKDGTRRELFWNDLVKTSLFATHNTTPDRETAYELNRRIAGVVNGLLLAMTTYLGLGLAFASKRAARKYAVVLLALGACGAFMVAFRVMIPAPHHTDFRHVFVALAPMALLYATVVGHARRRDLALEWVGYALAVPFMVLSIVYFIPKRDLVMRLTRRTVPVALESRAVVVPEGTPWDRDGNLIFEENETLEFSFPEPKTISAIDVSLDNNDRYEVVIAGDAGARVLVLGPAVRSRRLDGLARYQERVDPPSLGVRKITVRALSGDAAYSIGHFIAR